MARNFAREYARQVEFANIAGFNTVREYREAQKDPFTQEMLRSTGVEPRGELRAQIVGLADDPEAFSGRDLHDLIKGMFDAFGPDFNVDEFLDTIYGDTA